MNGGVDGSRGSRKSEKRIEGRKSSQLMRGLRISFSLKFFILSF